MRGIGTLADWIINDYGDWFDEQGREQIRLLKARVVRIDKLIDGMLQFSKIVRTRQKEKQVNLNTVLTDVIGKIKPPGNIEIAVDSLPGLTCEREHIGLIIRESFVKRGHLYGQTERLIKVGCVEQGDFWKFYVCDNGPGIEQKYFEKIFKIFQTLPGKEIARNRRNRPGCCKKNCRTLRRQNLGRIAARFRQHVLLHFPQKSGGTCICKR